MQRNTHTTALTDPPFSATEPGFTDGNATLGVPPSILESRLTNNLMEELARAVEGSGQDVLPIGSPLDNYDQLDDAVNGMAQLTGPANSEQRFVTNGLRFTTGGGSLIVTTLPGQIVFDGRRYVITQAKLDDALFDSFTLPATRDSYFFIAPEDPIAPTDDRRTVHIETLDVAVGAAPPATPAGTLLFQRLTTDGAGVTAVLDFNMGVPVVMENGGGVLFRRRVGGGSGFDLTPFGNDANIGNDTDPQNVTTPETGSYFDKVCAKARFLKSSHSGLNPGALATEFTRSATTTGSGDTSAITLYDEADWTDGTCIKVVANITAFNESDSTDSYAAEARFMVLRDGGSFSLEGSGVSNPEWEFGVGAIAALVSANAQISGGDLQLLVTGHNGAGQIMRWFVHFEVVISSHETDLP